MLKFKKFLLWFVLATFSFSSFSGGVHNWILEHPDSQANLTHSLIGDRFLGDPTFVRATTATLEDFEGIIKEALSGEARFKGARRVKNKYRYTSNLSNAYYAKTNGATVVGGLVTLVNANSAINRQGTFPVKHDYLLSFYAWGNTEAIRFELVDSADGSDSVYVDIPATATRTRYSVLAQYSLSSTYSGSMGFFINRNSAVTAGTTVNVENIQLEEVTGQTNQNPSEYVSSGVLSAPYHGCSVDGVQYFPYENGNTVASNVVTEARGADIPQSTLKGYMAENAATNLLTYSEDFRDTTDAGEARPYNYNRTTLGANTTIAPNGTETADKIQADATADGTHNISRALTLADNTVYTYSAYFKKSDFDWILIQIIIKDGASINSYFDLTNGVLGSTSAGTTAKIESVGNDWFKCSISGDSLTGGTAQRVDIYLAESNNDIYLAGTVTGEGVYVWGAQLEQGVHPTSYIPTEATAVVRNADILSYPSDGNIDSTKGSMSAEFTTEWTTETLAVSAYFLNPNGIIPYAGTDRSVFMYDGTTFYNTTLDITGSSSLQKIAANWGSSLMNTFLNGTAGTEGAFDGDIEVGTNMYIGNKSDGIRGLNGTIKNLKIWKRKLSSNLMIGETTL